MKHLNANLDNTTNIEVPLEETLRLLGLDGNNNVVEVSPSSAVLDDGGDGGGGGTGGDGGDNTDGDDSGGDDLQADQCVDLIYGTQFQFYDFVTPGPLSAVNYLAENFGVADGQFYEARIDASNSGLSRLRTLFPTGYDTTSADFISVTPNTITFQHAGNRLQFRYFSASMNSAQLVTLGGLLQPGNAFTLGTQVGNDFDLGSAIVWGPVTTGLNAFPQVSNIGWARSTTFNLGTLLETPADYTRGNFVSGTFQGFQFGGVTGQRTTFDSIVNSFSGSSGFTTSTTRQNIPAGSGGEQLACRVTQGANFVTFLVGSVSTGQFYLDRQLFFLGPDGRALNTDDFIDGSGRFTANTAIPTVVDFFPYTAGGTETRDAIEWTDGNGVYTDSGTDEVCADGLGGGDVTVDGDIIGMATDCTPITSGITFAGISTQPEIYSTFTTNSWTTGLPYLQEASQGNPGRLPGILSINTSTRRDGNTSAAQAVINLGVINTIRASIGQPELTLTGATGNPQTLSTFVITATNGLTEATVTVTEGDLGAPVVRQRFYVGSTKYIIDSVTDNGGGSYTFAVTGTNNGGTVDFLTTGATVYSISDDLVFTRSLHFMAGLAEFSVGSVSYWPYNAGTGLENRFLFLQYAPDTDAEAERNSITGGVGTGSQGVQLINKTRLVTIGASPSITSDGNITFNVPAGVDTQYIVGTRITVTYNTTETLDATIASIDGTEWTVTDLSATSDFTLNSIDRIGCADETDSIEINMDGDTTLGDTDVDGDLGVDGDLIVEGDIVLGDGLDSGGGGSFGGDLDVDGDETLGGDLIVGGDAIVDRSICQGGLSREETASIFSSTTNANVNYQGEVVTNVLISATLSEYADHATLNVGDYLIFQNTDPEDTTDNANPTSFTSGTYEVVAKASSPNPETLTIERASGNFKFNQATADIITYSGGTCTVGGDITVDGDVVADGDMNVEGDLTSNNLCVGGINSTLRYAGDSSLGATRATIGGQTNVITRFTPTGATRTTLHNFLVRYPAFDGTAAPVVGDAVFFEIRNSSNNTTSSGLYSISAIDNSDTSSFQFTFSRENGDLQLGDTDISNINFVFGGACLGAYGQVVQGPIASTRGIAVSQPLNSDATAVMGDTSPVQLWSGTSAQYMALTPDANTIYYTR